jgi:hypothetical protein
MEVKELSLFVCLGEVYARIIQDSEIFLTKQEGKIGNYQSLVFPAKVL